MTARENSMIPVGDVVAVLTERDYELMDRTANSSVFRSKNPKCYAFALPTTTKLIPVEIVRSALQSEPLDINAVLEQAAERADAGAIDEERDDDSQVAIDMDAAIRLLTGVVHRRANRTPDQIAAIQDVIGRIDAAHLDDDGPTDASENLDYYIYAPRHLNGD